MKSPPKIAKERSFREVLGTIASPPECLENTTIFYVNSAIRAQTTGQHKNYFKDTVPCCLDKFWDCYIILKSSNVKFVGRDHKKRTWFHRSCVLHCWSCFLKEPNIHLNIKQDLTEKMYLSANSSLQMAIIKRM